MHVKISPYFSKPLQNRFFTERVPEGRKFKDLIFIVSRDREREREREKLNIKRFRNDFVAKMDVAGSKNGNNLCFKFVRFISLSFFHAFSLSIKTKIVVQ